MFLPLTFFNISIVLLIQICSEKEQIVIFSFSINDLHLNKQCKIALLGHGFFEQSCTTTHRFRTCICPIQCLLEVVHKQHRCFYQAKHKQGCLSTTPKYLNLLLHNHNLFAEQIQKLWFQLD